MVDRMSRIVAHNRLRDGSLEPELSAGNRQSKTQRVEGKSRLLGDIARFLPFTKNESSNESQSEPLLRAELCSVWPK